jgi:hypothetical protein
MANKMPREIAPGVFWIGDCLAQRHKGKIYHGYNAAFLVAGETASVLVETGHPKDFPVIEQHMAELFARGMAPLKYLFVTHQETPRRPWPHPQDPSRRGPVRRRERLSLGIPAIRTSHAVDEGGR